MKALASNDFKDVANGLDAFPHCPGRYQVIRA